MCSDAALSAARRADRGSALRVSIVVETGDGDDRQGRSDAVEVVEITEILVTVVHIRLRPSDRVPNCPAQIGSQRRRAGRECSPEGELGRICY